MAFQSARSFLGLSISDSSKHQKEASLGLIETITIDPGTMRIDGFLVGRAGSPDQLFVPRECIMMATDHELQMSGEPFTKPAESRRILGLSAWTTHPRVLVGFVYDCHFSLDSGVIESFVIHQIIRTWSIPLTAVEKITPHMLLINNDTTIKLKITPYPSEPI